MENKRKFGPGLAIIFILNYVIGAGFLSLGRAFYDSGIVLGALSIVILAWLCCIAKDMFLVVMARAGNVQQMEIQSIVPLSPVGTPTTTEKALEMVAFQQDPSDQEPLSLLENDAEEEGQEQNGFGVECLERLSVGDKEIEMSSICGIYGGPIAEGITVCVVALSMYGTLWCFGTLFGHSLSERVSGTLNSNIAYLLWLGVFGAIVVPLSCKKLEEQVFFQVCLACCRFSVMILMVVVAFAGGTFKEGFDEADVIKPPLVHWPGLGTVMSSGLYAFNLHTAIPVLSHPVRNKKDLGFMFDVSIFICVVTYLTLGITVALKFGDNVQSSCNINFSGWIPPKPIPHWFGNVVSTIILIFPAIDVLSAFPLTAITLGENLLGVLGKYFSLDRTSPCVILIFRLLASVIPIIGASVYRNFESVIDITGLTAYVIIFGISAALLWKSSTLHPCHPTVHDTFFTKTRGIDRAFGFLGNVLLFLTLLDLARE